jgi:hypothetical protein
MPDVHLKDATEYPRRVAWVGATAPTTDTSITVGPGTLWVDTSSTPFVWKVRNTGDTGWDTIGVAGTPTSIANAGGSVVVNGSGQVTVTAPSGQDIRLFGPTGESVRTVHGVGAVLNGASNAYVQALNDDSVGMGGGPAGAAGAFVDAAGNLLLNGTTVEVTPALRVGGLTGSTSPSRYVGATASGAPTTGAHLAGDWAWALDAHIWLCTAPGTPGTWTDVTGGGGGSMSSFTLVGDGGTPQSITDGNTLTVAGGVGLASTAGVTDTVTVDLDINSLTADASPDGAADYVATWDASASAHKKVLLTNLLGGGSAAFAGAMASHNANQSISNASFTTLAFNGEVFDTDAFHDNATNNSRLTVPIGKGGYYLVGFDGWFNTNAVDVRFVRLLKNGTDELARDGKAGISGNGTPLNFTTLVSLAAADYLQVQVYQASGGALDLLSTDYWSPRFWLMKVG